MKTRNFAAAFLLGLFSVLTAHASDTPDFEKILKEIDDLGNFAGRDFSCVYTIVSEKPGEEKSVTQAKIFRRDDTDQFVLLILQPQVQRGQGYLKADENVWFYDPESRKFEKSTLRDNVQDSDAQNSDFNRSSLADDYEVSAWEPGTLGKFPVYILDLKAKHDDVSYDRIRIWVRQDISIVLKEENYSVSNRLMRTALYPKYTVVDDRYLPSSALIVDELNQGERTQFSIKDVRTDTIPDYVFTKAYLEQVNN
ncbi:MAG: outer membrane lipoprotein-sorting protein [Spirochaetales bacterium]|nr:outer membrane lipoprotein-sorting protein [Spirochaetales bacterium]